MITRNLRASVMFGDRLVPEGSEVKLVNVFLHRLAPKGILVVIEYNGLYTIVQPEAIDTVAVLNDDPDYTEIDFSEFEVKPHITCEDGV